MANFVPVSAYQPTYGTAVGTVGAGATLAGGWIDVAGGIWSVDAFGNLTCGTRAGSSWNNALLMRPAGEAALNTRIRYRRSYNSAEAGNHYTCLRVQYSSSLMQKGYAVNPFVTGSVLRVYTVNGGTLGGAVNGTMSASIPTGIYDVEISCVQTNITTTTITANVYDATTGTLVSTGSIADTVSALQNLSGVCGVFSNNNVIIIQSNVIFTDQSSPAAATQVFCVSGANNHLVASGSTSPLYFTCANGTLSGDATISLTDSNSGTFSGPVVLAASGGGSATATWSYTPSVAGTRTITFTNNRGLTNPTLGAVTVTTPIAAPKYVAVSAYQPTYGTAVGTVGAGATLAGGWIDVTGGIWSVSSTGVLTCGTYSGSTWNTVLLMRPSGEATVSGKMRYRRAYDTAETGKHYTCFRVTYGSGAMQTGYAINPFNTVTPTLTVYAISGGTLPGPVTSAMSSAIPTGTYDIEITCTQTDTLTTTIVANVYDASTGTLVSSGTVTDTQSALQNISGVCGMFSGSNVANIQSTVTFTDQQTPGAATRLFCVSGANNHAGSIGTASPRYFTCADGYTASDITVSVSDGSGGSFTSPITITAASNGTGSAQWTYTPASSGTKTLAVTNNRGLTNPTLQLVSVAAAGTTLSVLDSNILWSPGSWDFITPSTYTTNGTSAANAAQTGNGGAYCKFQVTGTANLGINLDTSTLAGLTTPPRVMYSLNGGAWQISNLSSGQTSITVSASLNTTLAYTLEFRVAYTDQLSGNRFGTVAGTGPNNVVRITSFNVDTGYTVSPYPIIQSKKAIFFGDSITEGILSDPSATFGVGGSGAFTGFATMLGQTLQVEYGQIGFGSQGFEMPGTAGVKFNSTSSSVSTWDKFSTGRTRTLTGFDYVFCFHATNDALHSVSTSAVQNDVVDFLTRCRAATSPGTWIFVCAPPGGYYASTLSAGVSAYLASHPGDAYARFIDVSSVFATTGMHQDVSPSQMASDGLHPYWWAGWRWGATVAEKVLPLLTPVFSVAHFR